MEHNERQDLLTLLAQRDAEIARLRAAGRALAPHVLEHDAFMDVHYCGACRITMSDDEDFVHAADCPVLVFSEGNEA